MRNESTDDMAAAFKRLAEECTDFRLEFRDWPRVSGVHWTATACRFLVGARCCGRTADEAVDRAIARMRKIDATLLRHGTWEDLHDLLPGGDRE